MDSKVSAIGRQPAKCDLCSAIPVLEFAAGKRLAKRTLSLRIRSPGRGAPLWPEAIFSSVLLNFFRHLQDLEQGDGVVQSTH